VVLAARYERRGQHDKRRHTVAKPGGTAANAKLNGERGSRVDKAMKRKAMKRLTAKMGRAYSVFLGDKGNGLIEASFEEPIVTAGLASARCAVAFANLSGKEYVAPWLPLTFPQTYRQTTSANPVPAPRSTP
jgi:hypothetical protein